MGIRRVPRTRHERGHAWATLTLLFCGAFSLYANVRSGQIAMEPVIISSFPPVVAFLTSKLIAYFNPKTVIAKIMVYGGFGIICVISMGASGFHIVDTVVRNGQTLSVGLMYVFITDAPMLLAAGILVQKIPTTMTTDKKTATVTTGPVQTVAPSKTVPAKSTKPPAKTTTARKSTKPSRNAQTTPSPTFSTPLDDPVESDMIKAGNSR